MSNAYLEIITPKGRKKLPLTSSPVTIGRVEGNQLQINSDNVSRHHCVIERTSAGFQLRDLKSRNGTKVNGEAVDEKVLAPGDKFIVGDISFVYHDDGPATASPAPVRKAAAAEADAVAQVETRPATNAPEGGSRAKSVARSLLRRKKPEKKPEPVAEQAGLDAYASESESGEVQHGTTKKSATSRTGAKLDPSDPIGTLRALCATAAKKDFDEHAIAMVNARGQTVHESNITDEIDDDDIQESVLLLRLILLAAFRTGASDLHFEPRNQETLVRMRVDGTMVSAVLMNNDVATKITSTIKVLGDIDISQRNMVQEGHFSTQVPGRSVDYRVSFTPSMYGQKLVVRVLDSANAPQHMEELQLPGWMFQTIRKVSKQTSGMVLVCGPTGSGKTTTLYSVLRDIDTYERNVITIEDPVEYQIDGVTQIPADEARGNTFHTLLRSVLRQDPDVILLGEIRDEETAKTGMQAAMTGHLVLSTVHAKDTIGTIFRLLDLGVEPYLVASSLNLILAQRLIRVLCDNCKAPKKPTPKETMRMGRRGRGIKAIYYNVGCPKCLGVGYRGRRGLYELLNVTEAVRDCILNNPTMGSIREALNRGTFITLEDMAWEYVGNGVTSVEEVERITESKG